MTFRVRLVAAVVFPTLIVLASACAVGPASGPAPDRICPGFVGTVELPPRDVRVTPVDVVVFEERIWLTTFDGSLAAIPCDTGEEVVWNDEVGRTANLAASETRLLLGSGRGVRPVNEDATLGAPILVDAYVDDVAPVGPGFVTAGNSSDGIELVMLDADLSPGPPTSLDSETSRLPFFVGTADDPRLIWEDSRGFVGHHRLATAERLELDIPTGSSVLVANNPTSPWFTQCDTEVGGNCMLLDGERSRLLEEFVLAYSTAQDGDAVWVTGGQRLAFYADWDAEPVWVDQRPGFRGGRVVPVGGNRVLVSWIDAREEPFQTTLEIYDRPDGY